MPQYDRPFFWGVVGPQWRVPIAEHRVSPYTDIASPMPYPDYSTRITPNDFPPITYSPTSFDLPLRRDVLQMRLPYSGTHTMESRIDPRFPLKKPVRVLAKTLMHNTRSVDPEVNKAGPPGTFAFLEKKNKYLKKHKKHSKSVPSVSDIRHEGVEHLNIADRRSTHIMDLMTPWPAQNRGEMVLGVEVLNKRDPSIKLYQDNKALYERMHQLRNHPQGVRSAHTKRFLPLA